MKLRTVLPLMIGTLIATPLAAQVHPQPGSGDPHLQTVTYNADQVVLLETAPGYQLTVGLAPDEQIESVAVGDSADWQVSASHNGDHLFIKPLAEDARTNMTVVTTTRIYTFDLVSLSQPSASMPYIVQFVYPGSERSPTAGSNQAASPTVVGEYVLHGDRALRPSAMMDDGQHTYIEWPAGVPLPATYFRDENGVETLANGEMRRGDYVIDSVHRHLIFRIDHHKAEAERVVPGETHR